MICKTCGNPIPEASQHPDPNIHKTVTPAWAECMDCVKKKSNAAVEARQLQALSQIVRGKGALKTAVISRVRHLSMFGFDLTWCKTEVKASHKKGYLEWDELDKADVCTNCRIRVRRAAQDAVAA